jgi:hypothetical protein
MSEEQDTRQRYTCKCPCGNVFYAAKSIMQEWGILDTGHGSCPECKTFYNLAVDEVTKTMKLTPWDEYVKNRKIEECE